jgi:hypothetical protein
MSELEREGFGVGKGTNSTDCCEIEERLLMDCGWIVDELPKFQCWEQSDVRQLRSRKIGDCLHRPRPSAHPHLTAHTHTHFKR